MERVRIRTVAIIGGGPAGAQCARSLRERGFDVTLFEPRSAFEKACGGGIPARGLDHFPFLRDGRLSGKLIRRCLVIAPSGRETEFPLRDPLAVVSRADLHTFLLDRAVEAGARLVRARVVSFARHEAAGWLLGTVAPGQAPGAGAVDTGPFDFLVAADGAAGSARRRLAAVLPADDLTQGLGYFVPGLSEDRITLKFYDGLDGYLWIFPRTDHSSAGICAGLGERPAADLKRLLDRFIAARYGEAALARSERYSALIPGAPRDPESAALQGDGWAFVGDSGRAVDPLTREGIYYAMLAGETLARSLADGDPGRYAADWRGICGGELSWAARHAHRFFERRFIERMVAVCASSPAVARVLSDLIAGRQAYRNLKLRLVLNAPRIGMHLAGAWLSRAGRAMLRPARGS